MPFDPLLTVAIPTRNRWDTLTVVVAAMLRSTEREFEILVQDNSDKQGLQALLPDDERLRYVHSRDLMNMHRNFDRAIELAKGHYVICLGDDDALRLDLTMPVLREAHARNFDAVLSALDSYYWPGLHHWHWGDVGGKLDAAPRKTPPSQATIDVSAELGRLMREGLTGGLGKLPRVYQGFASRSALAKLRERCGTCFPGASPDMANAVGLSTFVDQVLWDDRPLVVSGHSPKSGGGQGAAGLHHGRLEDQSHLPATTIANWNPAIPHFWSGRTIYAQSACDALRASRHPDPPLLDPTRLYAACLIYEPKKYFFDILAASRHAPQAWPLTIFSTAGSAAAMFAQRAQKFLSNSMRKRIERGRDPTYASIGEVLPIA